jgi:uroporphyrinogen-III synthase
MNDNAVRILSTRTLETALIEKAACADVSIDIATFIEIQKLITQEVQCSITKISKQRAVVVFTSMNAVEVLVDALPKEAVMPDWKIYCIGGATFTLVKKYWPYESVQSTAKDAAALAERIIADGIKEIIFFCGNKRREELPELLKLKNIIVNELKVYETVETPGKIERHYNGILFFSPSAVHSFFSKNKIASDTTLFAIGKTTAGVIKQFSDNNIIISDFPAKDQLVDKAIHFFTSK